MTAAGDLELAQDAERIARRLAERHPDPKARETYRWIAERAAARQEERRGASSSGEVNGVHLHGAARAGARPLDSGHTERDVELRLVETVKQVRPMPSSKRPAPSSASASPGRAPWNLPPKGAAMTAQTPSTQPPDDLVLLSQTQAAEFLTVQPRTLEGWRYRGDGPRFIRVGRYVRYRLRDLRVWLEENTFRSTTEADNPA